MIDNPNPLDNEQHGEKNHEDASTPELSNLLGALSLTQYEDEFIENDLTSLDTLLMLDEQDLEKIGVTSLGHRKQIIAALNDLKPSPPATAKAEPPIKTETIVIKEQASSSSGLWTFVGVLLIILLIIVIIGALGI
jgi:hypothetical protein